MENSISSKSYLRRGNTNYIQEDFEQHSRGSGFYSPKNTDILQEIKSRYKFDEIKTKLRQKKIALLQKGRED
jgi:hypothetical protein